MKRYLIFSFIYLIVGCDFLTMDRIPTEVQIKTSFDPFLVGASSIKGIYSNMDVDSAVFEYKTDNEYALLEISKRLTSKKWSVVSNENRQLVVTRRKNPGEGELHFHSFELAKLAFENGYICIGYVQADTNEKVTGMLGQEAGEIQWADKNIWPKYNSCVNSHNNSHHSQP